MDSPEEAAFDEHRYIAAQLAPRMPQMTPREALQEVLWHSHLHPLRYTIGRDEQEATRLWNEARDLAVRRMWRSDCDYGPDAMREFAVEQVLTAAATVVAHELQQMLARSPYPVELLLCAMGETYCEDYDDWDEVATPGLFDVEDHQGTNGDVAARDPSPVRCNMLRTTDGSPLIPPQEG